MRVKIFDFAQRLDLFAAEENKLEKIINDWLQSNPNIVIKDIRLGSSMISTADAQEPMHESFNTLTQILVLYEERS
jgi:hypothetical protein